MGKDKNAQKEKAFVHKIDDAVETTGKAVGGVGGGLTGAGAGAIIGTVICPGIGTAIGAAAGAVGGGAGGAALGKLTGKVVTGVRKVGSGALRGVTGQKKTTKQEAGDKHQLIEASAPALEEPPSRPPQPAVVYPAHAAQPHQSTPYPTAADPNAPPPYAVNDDFSYPPPYPANSGTSSLYPSLQ